MFGFTSMFSLPPILTLVPVVSKIKRVKCPWTMYLKMTKKRGMHSAAVRLRITFRETTLLMVRVPRLCGAYRDSFPIDDEDDEDEGELSGSDE
jgi:hypothetical protein